MHFCRHPPFERFNLLKDPYVKTFKKQLYMVLILSNTSAVMKSKAILLTIAIGAPIVSFLHLNAALHASTSESQSFDVIKKDGVTRLVNKDGSKLTSSQVDFINNSDTTNIGTAIGLRNFNVTGLVIRQDYNSFGWKAGGDVTFITSK